MKLGIIVALSTILTCFASGQDTVHVKAGWNILGSVSAGAVPDVLFTIPDSLVTSSYWGYTPGVGYESTDTLETGLGYWVKAKGDGLIVFNNVPPVDSCKSKAFIYEGKLYHTVLIGDQCWMAENLNLGVMIQSTQVASDNDTTEKYCYNDDSANCVLYGGLYKWSEAMKYTTTSKAQGICPTGWHIPTLAEFQTLFTQVNNDCYALKTVGEGNYMGATNMSGFSALYGGYRYFVDGRYLQLGNVAFFWTSTETVVTTGAYFIYLNTSPSINTGGLNKEFAYSIRCLED